MKCFFCYYREDSVSAAVCLQMQPTRKGGGGASFYFDKRIWLEVKGQI